MTKYAALKVLLISTTRGVLKKGPTWLSAKSVTDQRFTNVAIRRHNNLCHTKREFDCPECGMVLNTDNPVQSQHGAQDLAFAVMGDVLQLEEGFGGCSC